MGRLLVLSGGHPYEAAPFEELLNWLARELGGWELVHLVHPEAEQAVAAGAADGADALLFYDMGGYEFADGKVTSCAPTKSYQQAIRRRFAAGKGAVAMHHALAGWADWPDWAEMLGGRFLYQPGEWRGEAWPDSGYRHDVEYQAEVVASHPVTAGIPASFAMVDELYLCPIDEAAVTPLVRAQHRFTRDNFYSAALAVSGELYSNKGWDHPDGSNCVAWERRIANAALVYLQFGDGPDTYRDANVRRLLLNALQYTSGGKP